MLLVPLLLIILGGSLFLLTYSKLNPVTVSEELEQDDRSEAGAME